MVIDKKCPTCGGDVEVVDIQSRALRPGRMGRGRVTRTYKCLANPYMGHMPLNWQPGAPTEPLV